MESQETNGRSKERTSEKPKNSTVEDEASTQAPVFLARQYSSSEGGVPTDMLCPSCSEDINGSYLPVFKCPHCEITIWRDENGDVTSFENKYACPECGRGSAMELAKEALVTSLVSGFRAILLYSLKVDQRARTNKLGGIIGI